MSKKTTRGGTYKCPDCGTRVPIEIKGGAWYWGRHTRDGTPNGELCNLSGKRMA